MPPLSAATGLFNRPKLLLAASLYACNSWRAMAGELFVERIYFDALPPPNNHRQNYTCDELQELRPFIVIFNDEETGLKFRHGSTGTRRRFHDSGTVKCYIERDVPPEIANDPAEVDRTFENIMGVMIPELLALAGQSGYLAINELDARGPMRSHTNERSGKGDYQQFYLTCQWGRE